MSCFETPLRLLNGLNISNISIERGGSDNAIFLAGIDWAGLIVAHRDLIIVPHVDLKLNETLFLEAG